MYAPDEMNGSIIGQYLKETTTRGLHIGCGSHLLSGWLNSDYLPRHKSVLKLDATEPYPFDNGSFDYVYSEHIIEHVSFEKGKQILRECCRILKTHGKIRISTPDLTFLFALFSEPHSALHSNYIEWATNTFISGAPCYHPTFVINNFMRAWGHQFVYDETVIRLSLESAGFSQIKRCVLNASDDPALCNLENEARMPAGFLRLESMVFEGTKDIHDPTQP
jgi:predicted SAM-dependent methyltransferase